MTERKLPIALTTLALAGILAAAPLADARAQCKSHVETVMSQMSIDPAKVTRKLVEPIEEGADNIRTTGYRIWLHSNVCEGSVVIRLDLQCKVVDTFSRGQCKLEAIKK